MSLEVKDRGAELQGSGSGPTRGTRRHRHDQLRGCELLPLWMVACPSSNPTIAMCTLADPQRLVKPTVATRGAQEYPADQITS